MSRQNTLENRFTPLMIALGEVCAESYHYWRSAPKGVDAYIVWAEDEESESLNADNKKQRQGIHGTIDFFTKQEFDSRIDELQEKLNTLENYSWRLNSVQYEDETNFIHYEWDFWVR